MTRTVTSADGTAIAFDQLGEGPPVVMVVGAFNTRATTGPLAAALQDRFTIFNYDRRGRGDSGDTAPYAVDREIEDLDALVEESSSQPRWSLATRPGPSWRCGPPRVAWRSRSWRSTSQVSRTDDRSPGLPSDLAAQTRRPGFGGSTGRGGGVVPDEGGGHPCGGGRPLASGALPAPPGGDRPHARLRRDDHRRPFAARPA